MKTLFQTLGNRIGWNHYEGDVGIEVEVEGRNLPRAPVGWVRTEDGSLRGAPEAYEYILRQPVSIDNLSDHINNLRAAYQATEAEVVDSVRTSVHVHVNIQDLNLIELYNFITLYLIMENILTEYCGERRAGNFFCLRARDADFIVHVLANAAKQKSLFAFDTPDLRYAAMNLQAVVQRGSLEFRAMRGTEDFDMIEHWARLLVSLRESAKSYRQPCDVILGFSEAEGPNFVREVLGELGRPIAMLPGIGDKVKEGMRYAQDVAFATDWAAYKEWIENRFKNNPFAAAIDDAEENPRGLDEYMLGRRLRRARRDLGGLALDMPQGEDEVPRGFVRMEEEDDG